MSEFPKTQPILLISSMWAKEGEKKDPFSLRSLLGENIKKLPRKNEIIKI